MLDARSILRRAYFAIVVFDVAAAAMIARSAHAAFVIIDAITGRSVVRTRSFGVAMRTHDAVA